MPELLAVFAIPIRLPHHTNVRPPACILTSRGIGVGAVKWGRFDSYGREVLSGDFLLQKSLSSGSGVGRPFGGNGNVDSSTYRMLGR